MSETLAAPVSDATELGGVFDVRLVWRPDDLQAAAPGAAVTTNTSELPSLFGAVEEQLGLRLKSARVKTRFAIVDGIHRIPSEKE